MDEVFVMKKEIINDYHSLEKIVGYMHDSGFSDKDMAYDAIKKEFVLRTKVYEFKGTFLQRQTNAIKGKCCLVLCHVSNMNVVCRDRKGYEAVGEDYLNMIKMENASVLVIKTTFQEIELHVEKFSGMFEYDDTSRQE
jgi:hypothetical protein